MGFFFQTSNIEDGLHVQDNIADKVNKSTNYIIAEYINKYKVSLFKTLV